MAVPYNAAIVYRFRTTPFHGVKRGSIPRSSTKCFLIGLLQICVQLVSVGGSNPVQERHTIGERRIGDVLRSERKCIGFDSLLPCQNPLSDMVSALARRLSGSSPGWLE